jgi:hypothetical protein
MNKYYKEIRRRRISLKRSRSNWIGYILRRNGLLKHVIEGKIEGRTSDGKMRKRT